MSGVAAEGAGDFGGAGEAVEADGEVVEVGHGFGSGAGAGLV